MILPEIIKKVEASTDFALWTATPGKDNVCKIFRVSGFKVDDDNEHITFFLPEYFFRSMELDLVLGSNINLLMASLMDFESYQIKGNYVSSTKCTKDDEEFYQFKVLKVIDILNGMGLNAKKIFSYLYEVPNIAVKFKSNSTFLQTPKPGTGTRLKN